MVGLKTLLSTDSYCGERREKKIPWKRWTWRRNWGRGQRERVLCGFPEWKRERIWSFVCAMGSALPHHHWITPRCNLPGAAVSHRDSIQSFRLTAELRYFESTSFYRQTNHLSCLTIFLIGELLYALQSPCSSPPRSESIPTFVL